MLENFWRLLRTYCLQSTIVGLKYFYLYPDIISRCFWATNMIAVVMMSWRLAYLLYNRFTEMPTRVTIESQFEPVMNLPYPAITLCSPNQISISSMNYFKRSLVDGNVTIDLEAALPAILGFYQIINDLDNTVLTHLQRLFDLNRYTVPEVMGRMPQSCDKFLKRCYLEGKHYENCSDLFKPILTVHGYCCAFNSQYSFNGKRNMIIPNFKNRTVQAVGFTNALIVVTDYDVEDAMPGTLVNAGAILVMYTDWTEFPSDDEMAVIDTRGESYHILHAVYTYCSDDVQSLPVWSRKCYFEDEHHLPFFRKYHNSDCDHMCYVAAVYKACGCFPAFLPFIREDTTCRITSIPCIIKVKKDMNNWLLAHQCDCPRDCVSRKYRADFTLGNFNALPYVIRNPYMGLKLNISTSAMHFYFSNPVYMQQKQETVMSIISLASNLGGVFGLFMGCSCISVLEIFFYIYLGIKNYIRCRLEKWMRNTLRKN
ncbi:hypothetical protein PYW08_007522 [Mythimna loreyi]|uniref:Uncharacterized protein n=1 Tax=Mythimna loreyi TaxID=667449 RepID=A0ACC2QBZ5_9NEOP|nr:hypothetical protein PYW08_007522 [Mythimna loreyi]